VNNRILVVYPAVPNYQALGAASQDQMAHLADFLRLGYSVHLVTRGSPYRALEEGKQFYQRYGIEADLVPWTTRNYIGRRLRDIAFLDGMAWDYAKPDFQEVVRRMIVEWKPDLVWCHTTFLWSAAALASRFNIPAVIRSINFEPNELRHSSATKGLLNQLRMRGKWLGEKRAMKNASVLVPITPEEATIYRSLDPRINLAVLPLGTLSRLLTIPYAARDRSPLHVYFMGSTYSVAHNRAALEFIVQQVVPEVRRLAPGAFVFHILGRHVPSPLANLATPDLVFEGFVPDLDPFLAGMDIALVPSLFGPGMQQKIFEPLARAFPTITQRRGLGGYNFEGDVHLLLAEDAQDFARQLIRLQSHALRNALSKNVRQRAIELFSQDQLDAVLQSIFDQALQTAS